MLETALNEEMTGHPEHEKNRVPEERESTNVRNRTPRTTVLTHATQVEPEVPRDRDGSFELVIVTNRQRRPGEVEEIVLVAVCPNSDDGAELGNPLAPLLTGSAACTA